MNLCRQYLNARLESIEITDNAEKKIRKKKNAENHICVLSCISGKFFGTQSAETEG